MIPDEDVRKRLMPELFKCDLDEFYETCEIFADSEEINGILVEIPKHFHGELAAFLRENGYQGYVSVEMGKLEDLSVIDEILAYGKELFG